MEVRERFTPSEPLRDALKDKLAASLSADDKARFQAGLFFYSYRRRVQDHADYFVRSRVHGGDVYNANAAFKQLPPTYHVQLGTSELDTDAPKPHLIFRAAPMPENDFPLEKLNAILSSVRSVEQEPIKATLGKHFFVELDRELLGDELEERVRALQALMLARQGGHSMYITPDRIIARATVMHRKVA